jgi:transcriptional regulator with XRE-family HTH domain
MSSGENIVERIDALLEDSDFTRADLCREAGISIGAMTDWAKKGSIPAADTLCVIADRLHTSVEYLVLGRTPFSLSPEALSIARKWLSLEDDGRKAVDLFIDFAVMKQVKKTARKMTPK